MLACIVSALCIGLILSGIYWKWYRPGRTTNSAQGGIPVAEAAEPAAAIPVATAVALEVEMKDMSGMQRGGKVDS